MAGRRAYIVIAVSLILLAGSHAFSQSPTTGRIAGTVKDEQEALIADAEVVIENPATGDKRSQITDSSGNYSIVQLSPGYYEVNIRAQGFTSAVFHTVVVGLGETTTINVILQLARSNVEITVNDTPPTIRSDGAELVSTIEAPSAVADAYPGRDCSAD